MLFASLVASLPKLTWDFDPVLYRLPKTIAVLVVGALGAVSLITGVRRSISDQTFTGILFLIFAGAIQLFMPDKLELRYYSLLFVVVFLGGHALLNWQIKRGGGDAEAA